MKFLKLFLSLCLTFTCSGCIKKESDAMKFKKEYESLNGTIREKDKQTIRTLSIDEDNPMVYSSCQDIVDRIENKETFIIYFGFSDCPWCRSSIETFIESAKENNITTIYYVDIKEDRDEIEIIDSQISISKQGSKEYYTLLELLGSVLDNYIVDETDTHEKRIYAPNYISILNGKPQLKIDGTSSLQSDGYQEINEDIKQDMKDQFQSLFDSIQTKACSTVEKKC